MPKIVNLKDFKDMFHPDKDKELNAEDINGVIYELEKYWKCGCGCPVFFLTPKGAKCRDCGLFCYGWADI